MWRWIFTALSVLSMVSFAGCGITRVIISERYTAAVSQNMNLASSYAVIGDVDQALTYMNETVKWLESKGMNRGYTSWFNPSPHDDVGRFYNNVVAERDALAKAVATNDAKERALIVKGLYRIRLPGSNGNNYIIIDRTQDMREPKGISAFPDNQRFFWWGLGSFVGVVLFGSMATITWSNRD